MHHDIEQDPIETVLVQIQADTAETISREPQESRQFLKRGSKGTEVGQLQTKLKIHGFNIVVDHDFGDKTEQAVRAFQRQSGLMVDGKVGDATWEALITYQTNSRYLTEQNFQQAAELLGVDVASVKAVAEVESAGGGFLQDGRPKILFERHKFYVYYKAAMGQTAASRLMQMNPNICNTKSGGYKGNEAEYPRLNAAKSYDDTSALLSASWGRFQVMGFNFKAAGFDTVHAFVTAMHQSEGAQLMAFCHFIKFNANLHKALKARRWAVFAAGYNGPNYKANNYDSKLAQAYARYVKG